MKGSVSVQVYAVPKGGNSVDEIEDRFVCRQKRNVLLSLGDGATTSAFSGEWADVLVNSGWKHALLDAGTVSGAAVSPARVLAWLSPLRKEFESTYASRDLPWYAKEKVRRGSHATFLAFRMNPSGRWSAVSCGDTCLMTIRDGQVADSIPLRSQGEFSNQPALVSSRVNGPLPDLTVHHGHRGESNEVLVLATDALACWLLGDDKPGRRIELLLACQTETDFERLVVEERERRTLKNDDATALLVRDRSQV